MVDTYSVIEGSVKFRDGRKWKSRWGVMRKLSPVADCLHLQLYRDSKDRYKQGQTKASLSLQHFLGVQSGFTLDKESNTIAIICQDVTVVLAFDTRERLIQWQVKIANNLGEDEQFLVQVSSGPQRAKLAPGPALLHVLERQFCLTVGVPPRLVGCWQINQLRRYGVVESRFCFEGGSRCGKGEGLYVLVTDQGEEITRTFRLAAEGKLSTRKRPASRNTSDSPKKSSHGRPETRLSDMSGLEAPPLTAESVAAEENCCGCSCGHEELGWSAVDTATDFADASSVADPTDPHTREGGWPDGGMERCASCISKLGALSRSSTAAMTPNTSFTPAWTMEANNTVTKYEQTRSNEKCNPPHVVHNQGYTEDDSYVAKRGGPDCWSSKHNQNTSGIERCVCCPPARPPKPGHLSCQPSKSTSCGSQPQKSSADRSPKKKQNAPNSCACNLTVNPYDNYDVPKLQQGYACPKEQNCHWFQNPLAGEPEFYDTPKTIKENIETDFGNYDTPPPVLMERKQMCTSIQKNQFLTRVVMESDEMHMVACPCQRMLCWAENWMFFPYCRRGSGRENTAPPPLHKKVTQCGGQVLLNNLSSVYATVDKSKKIRNRQASEDPSVIDKLQSTTSKPEHQHSEESESRPSNDNKISNEKSDHDSNGVNFNTSDTRQNYMNFDFVKSLEFYENSKDMMQKSCHNQKENNKTDNESKSVGTNTTPQTPESQGIKICTKCRHECKWPAPNPRDKQDDYLMMEPSGSENSIRTCDKQSVSSCGRHVPGYLPMHPIGGPSTMSSQDLFKLKLYQQQMMSGGERAASSPSLTDHSTERSRRRSDVEMHRTGGSTMFGFNQSISAANSPYLRRRVLGCLHESSESEITNLVSRKRSCSADSANNLKESLIATHRSVQPNNATSDHKDNESIHNHKTQSKKSVDFNMETITMNDDKNSNENVNVAPHCFTRQQELSVNKDHGQYENIQFVRSSQTEPLVHVRRSSSAPNKSNHNRDSSSSNDSGVSSCSLKKQTEDFAEGDLKPGSSGISRRYTYTTTDKDLLCKCFHSSLPRRSKSVDPLRDLAFQFQKVEVPMKSSSAEAEVPIFHAKRESRGCLSPSNAVPYMDSRSTSSGTSDMSDYFETLSLSSYSSSDTPDSLHFGHQAVCTMRPRSGKEYQQIDSILDTELKKIQQSTPSVEPSSSLDTKEATL